MADWPALIACTDGVAKTVKSLKKMAMDTVAVCPPLVPETEKLRGLAVVAVSPETVTVLLSPTVMEDGLKEQVAPLVHDRVMEPANELGDEALITKVVEVVPIWRAADRLLAESEKTAFPVPIRATLCWVAEALLLTKSVPVRLPLAAGVKVTLTSQPSPTFSTLGNEPQVLVSAKSAVTLMEERVIELLPVFDR